MSSQHFDVIVVGGGLVGMSAAIALDRQGLRVLLCAQEAATAEKAQPDAEVWDSRIYAISPGNARWLDSLNVWQGMDTGRFCPIDTMQVYGDEDGQLTFSAMETNTAELGFILESSALMDAMREALAASPVEVIQEELAGLALENGQGRITVATGATYTAQLVVAADGGNSWARRQAGIQAQAHAYQERGLVANFNTELAHHHTAYQWFGKQGVLAWLPLPGNRISIVWSTPNADALMQLTPETLAEQVAAAGNHQLGKLTLLTAPCSYPLQKKSADALVKPCLALVGDAAHQVHPLAGQGVNLGFRDVIALCETLASRYALQPLGDYSLLRRYERARKADILGISGLTHGLHELFATEQPVLKQVRNRGMRILQQSGIKKHLIRQALA